MTDSSAQTKLSELPHLLPEIWKKKLAEEEGKSLAAIKS